jgi:chromate transporter
MANSSYQSSSERAGSSGRKDLTELGSLFLHLGFTAFGGPAAHIATMRDEVVRRRKLFLTFLKIGSILYGSGYVLLAFLRADFVNRLGWLTDKQLIDAVAIGQITPEPVFTTATFIGYVLGGIPGAILSTLGIFLPSFIFVALSNPLIPNLRQSAWAGSFLDGVNVASLGLMAAVTWQLGQAAIIDLLTLAISVISTFLLVKLNVQTTWLILGGAILGLIASVLM